MYAKIEAREVVGGGGVGKVGKVPTVCVHQGLP